MKEGIEVKLFPSPLYMFRHDNPIIDEEVDGIPNDPDILSHLSEGANEEILYGSHQKMNHLQLFEKYNLPYLREFFEKSLAHIDPTCTIMQSWLNRGRRDSFQIAHTHANFSLSGVYYNHCCLPEQGGIVFLNPNPLSKMCHWGTEEGRHFPAVPRTLLIFPSWLEHKTEKNLIDTPRVSIAFNAK